MAYLFELFPIPPELDGRRTARLTDEQKHQVRVLRGQGWTYARIASEFNISATFAQRICKPEYAAAQDANHKEGKYYDKDKQAAINKRSRARRKALFDPDRMQWKTAPSERGQQHTQVNTATSPDDKPTKT